MKPLAIPRNYFEQVHCEQYSGTRAQKALGIVHEATAEVAFANRRDSLRTGVLMVNQESFGWSVTDIRSIGIRVLHNVFLFFFHRRFQFPD